MKKSVVFGLWVLLGSSSFGWANNFNVMLNVGGGAFYYKATQNLLVGPTFVSLSSSDETSKTSASGLGIRANYSFNEAFTDSWYVGGEISKLDVKSDLVVEDVKGTATLNATAATLAGGYHWYWGNFNTMLGVAVVNYSNNDIEVKDANGELLGTAKMPSVSGLDLAIGYSF